MATETETAWAAGLFEGEGCLTFKRHGERVYVRAQLGMADRDVVERFALFAGGGTVRTRVRQQPGWSDIHEWSWTESRGVARLIKALLPWLGARRSEQARTALTVLANVQQAAKNRTHCSKGHPYSGDNVRLEGDGSYTWRRCRACKRDYDAARYAKRGVR